MTKEEQIREILILESEQVDDRVIAGFTELGLSKVIPRLAALFPKTDEAGLALLTYSECYKLWTDADDYDLHKAFTALIEAQARKQQAADHNGEVKYLARLSRDWLEANKVDVAAAVKARDDDWAKWVHGQPTDNPYAPYKITETALEARISEVKNV
jgi:hypothetical protein